MFNNKNHISGEQETNMASSEAASDYQIWNVWSSVNGYLNGMKETSLLKRRFVYLSGYTRED